MRQDNQHLCLTSGPDRVREAARRRKYRRPRAAGVFRANTGSVLLCFVKCLGDICLRHFGVRPGGWIQCLGRCELDPSSLGGNFGLG